MPSGEQETIIIQPEEVGERLDKILTQRFLEVYSRTYFQYLIEKHLVLVNGEPVKKRIKPALGDEVEIEFALTPEIPLEPENIPLDICFEDEHLLVVNKPPGLVIHPAPGNWSGTFVNALLYYCKELTKETPLRPGIVHRLDKDTSGLLIAAKSTAVQQQLIEQFAERKVYKEYVSICMGNPGTLLLDAPIGRHPIQRQKMAVLKTGGKESRTRIETLKSTGKFSLVKVILETGRTHQIRVHLKEAGHPVLGDSLYGNQSLNAQCQAMRQMLHAGVLRLKHPITGLTLELRKEPPEDMQAMLKKLNLS